MRSQPLTMSLWVQSRPTAAPALTLSSWLDPGRQWERRSMWILDKHLGVDDIRIGVSHTQLENIVLVFRPDSLPGLISTEVVWALFQRQVLRVFIAVVCVLSLKPQTLLSHNFWGSGIWEWLGGSGLGSLMKLQSKCQPGLPSSENLTGDQGSSLKMAHLWLKMAHSHGYWLEASVPSILPSTCLWTCLSVFTTW